MERAPEEVSVVALGWRSALEKKGLTFLGAWSQCEESGEGRSFGVEIREVNDQVHVAR